ncbi:hypothetical protein D7Y15_34220 [Corallococcus sp. AB030]|nr:hypothetical protein D7Y15_34220 [Corallococcus sp. AB030]
MCACVPFRYLLEVFYNPPQLAKPKLLHVIFGSLSYCNIILIIDANQHLCPHILQIKGTPVARMNNDNGIWRQLLNVHIGTIMAESHANSVRFLHTNEANTVQRIKRLGASTQKGKVARLWA